MFWLFGLKNVWKKLEYERFIVINSLRYIYVKKLDYIR